MDKRLFLILLILMSMTFDVFSFEKADNKYAKKAKKYNAYCAWI